MDRQGLRDIKTLLLQEVQTCPLNTQETADFIKNNIVHICLVVILAIVILTILIIKTVRSLAGKQSVKKEALEDVFYSDKVFIICQESLAEDVKYLSLV